MVGLIATIIGAVLLVVLLVNVLVPIVKTATQATTVMEAITHSAAIEANEDVTLGVTSNLVSGSLTITGMTLATNYTVDYSTGVVTFLGNASTNGTYDAEYQYLEASYVDNRTERSLLALLVLIGIVGAVLFVLRAFGVIG